tara:strand:- start:1 stop:2697 length:2697 start_codon:yes stop_codon:yes gene_type:complete
MPDPFKQVKIIELMELFDDDEVTTADKIDPPEENPYRAFMERNPLAGGGMLVEPGFGGVRQGYAESTGIQLSKKQKKLLKDTLTKEEFKKLNFDAPLKSDAINYGVRQRDDKALYRKVVNIISPGKADTGVKILNRENLKNALIKSANAGDSLNDTITKMQRLDDSLNKNQISSAINALVKRGNIKKQFGVPTGGAARYGFRVGDLEKANDLIKKEVNLGELNKSQIAKKADVSDSFVERWIISNKGQKFHDENYNYEKGRLKTGTLQKQKDLFNYIETVDNISAKEIKKLFKMKSGKETQKLMSDLVGVIYRVTGIRGSREGSLIVPYDDEGRMREVLAKIRNAPDFEDIYQRRIGDLVRQAYPKGPKRNQAIKSLGEYYKFSRALKEIAPELALSLDHVVPFQFLEEVKQGKNPINLIKVKPIPQAVNRFKANFDAARIELNRQLKINPKDKNLLNKFKLLRELEGLTQIEFGGVSAKGNVYDFKAKPIGQSNLIKDAIKGIETYDKIGTFSKQVLGDEALQKKLIKAGVETGKDFAAFKKIKPLELDIRKKVLELASQVTDRCAIGKAGGGRIGYSLGSEACFKIGQKKLGDILTKGAGQKSEQLLATQILKAGPLLKDAVSLRALLGPQAMIFYAGAEAGLVGYDMITKGKTLKEAVADSLLNPALGPKLKQDSQKLFVERLQNLGVSDQEIGEGLMFDRMTEDVQTLSDLLQRKFVADQKVEQSKQLYPAAVDKEEREAPGVGGFKFDKPFLSIPDVRDKRKKEASDIAMDIQDIYRTGDRNVLDALEFEEFQKPETMKRFIEAKAQKDYLDKVVAADRLLDAQDNILYKYGKGPRFKEKDREQIGEVFDIPPGFKFAGGGIAKLAGIDEGPPPESGPNSQGLSGLLKRGNKI